MRERSILLSPEATHVLPRALLRRDRILVECSSTMEHPASSSAAYASFALDADSAEARKVLALLHYTDALRRAFTSTLVLCRYNHFRLRRLSNVHRQYILLFVLEGMRPFGESDQGVTALQRLFAAITKRGKILSRATGYFSWPQHSDKSKTIPRFKGRVPALADLADQLDLLPTIFGSAEDYRNLFYTHKASDMSEVCTLLGLPNVVPPPTCLSLSALERAVSHYEKKLMRALYNYRHDQRRVQTNKRSPASSK